MKAAIFLLCGAIPAAAQTAPKPFTKANTVVVQTPDSAATALRKLATVFVHQGYTVDKLDAQFMTLTLAPKIISDNRYTPTLTIRTTATAGANSELRISGDYKGFVGKVPLANVAQFYGGENSCNTACFRKLEQAALSYPSGKVAYAKQ